VGAITGTLVLGGPTGFEEHQSPRHPERPDRLRAVQAGIADLDLGTSLVNVTVSPVPHAALTNVHTARHVSLVDELGARGGGQIDADTYVNATSPQAARKAAGAGLAVLERLSADGSGVGFVAVRPPGHHALRDQGMGFCLFNNIAVAATWLADRGERVAIIDWDVHHGNGTQAIFWDDPRVLFASMHQYPLYPGSGAAEETGGPGAPGLTVNVPLPSGATGDVALRALDEVIAPAVQAFSPTWVLVSAGFDAHRADPLASLQLSAGDFALMAARVAELASGPGRLVLFLEGGYDLEALRSSTAAALGALVGAPPSAIEKPTDGGPGEDWVTRAAAVRGG
jgi:acetoin utilization deacetylase AcuC-like enzyme